MIAGRDPSRALRLCEVVWFELVLASCERNDSAARMLKSFLRGLFLVAWLALCGPRAVAADANLAAANSAPSTDVIDRYEIDAESGILWKLGGGATPLSYTMLPQIITLKTPYSMHWKVGSGVLVVRSRYSLISEPIIRGPERYFFGATASGCMEWWDEPRHLCLFFASGGGAGIMHSKGKQIIGGQGEDLNLTWLIYGGARYRFNETMNASAGLYFQHISNGGMDRVNPGVNALGPMISLGWRY